VHVLLEIDHLVHALREDSDGSEVESPAGLAALPDGMAGMCVFADGTFATSPWLEAYLRAQASPQGDAYV
jgi:hypothetical protein